MKLYIKNMLVHSCKIVVKAELERLRIPFKTVELGHIEMTDPLTTAQQEELHAALLVADMELMDDKKSIMIEKIKNSIIEIVYEKDAKLSVNFSDHLSEKLDHHYTYLSNTFTEVTGMPILNFMIAVKVERVKELLLYEVDNLSEIAYKLNYSSVAHLSNQFKKVTGLTPSSFKNIQLAKREKAVT